MYISGIGEAQTRDEERERYSTGRGINTLIETDNQRRTCLGHVIKSDCICKRKGLVRTSDLDSHILTVHYITKVSIALHISHGTKEI